MPFLPHLFCLRLTKKMIDRYIGTLNLRCAFQCPLPRDVSSELTKWMPKMYILVTRLLFAPTLPQGNPLKRAILPASRAAASGVPFFEKS